MKMLRWRVQQAAREGGVNQLIVERDYAQTYVLLGLASQPELRETLVFKGGTALKKVHFGAYRFSELCPVRDYAERGASPVRSSAAWRDPHRH